MARVLYGLRRKLSGGLRLTPPQVLVLGFAGVILGGTVLLSLPVAAARGERLALVDALFTATSATCVTGLVVVDTGTRFSMFGQMVILLLIQAGGLGIMTMATLFMMFLGKRITLRGRLVIQEALSQLTLQGVVRLIKYVGLFTAAIEGSVAVILAARWIPEMGLGRGIYFGVFHAVSAFCNAGFDLFGDFRSLTGYVNDPIVNTAFIGAIILGGLGFTVIVDVYKHRRFAKLSLHSKLVLLLTAVFLATGTVVVFLFERGNPETLGRLPAGGKFLASLFQATTPRTAGFNTVSTASLRAATQFFLMMLMFIGASPGSTGGGIKTATFGVLVLAVLSEVGGRGEPGLFERRIPEEIVQKALAIAMSAAALIAAATVVLALTQEAGFLPVLFEATSAFGTVGLSLGITTRLSTLGKLVIILTMFSGRLGPLTLAFALGQRRRRAGVHYPEERVMVG